MANDKAKQCPKCLKVSGDDWTQCAGSCPMPGSPHFSQAEADLQAGKADPARPICVTCNAPANVAPWGEHFCGKTEMLGQPVPNFSAGQWITGGTTLHAHADDQGQLVVDDPPADGPMTKHLTVIGECSDVQVLAKARDLFPALQWTVERRDGNVVFEGALSNPDAAAGLVVHLQDGQWRAEACPDADAVVAADPIAALQGLRNWLEDGWAIANELLGGSIDHDLQRLQPKAGDVLVCTIADEGLDPATLLRLQQITPAGVQLVILPQGATLQVLDDAMLAAAGLQRIAKAEAMRGDWRICHHALKEAQDRLQAEGGRHSWLDGAVDIAQGRAGMDPFPARAQPRAEIRDGEDSSSACARASAEDEELEEAGWKPMDGGGYTRRGWTVEIGYLGAPGLPDNWIARRPEGGTVGGWPSAYLACKAVDKVIDQLDAAEMRREAGDPEAPLPQDASASALTTQVLLAWPGSKIEAAPLTLARMVPQDGDTVEVHRSGPFERIRFCYLPLDFDVHARSHPPAPAGTPCCWWYATNADPGRVPEKVTTIAAAVKAARG